MAKVVIGLSGGVDSSVAAHVLKEQGHEVIALFMINWHDKSVTLSSNCSWSDDLIYAELVARRLQIPFHTVDLSQEYKKRVVDYMFSEYEKGRTPNPDVLCNREVKFDVFMEKVLELGAEFVATGHYARKEIIEINGKKTYRLLAGIDQNKDQSYFLCQLSQQQLEKALFPIGDIVKPEVRRIAAELKLASAEKKDSQGICFVGKVDLPVFLQQKLKPKEGNIIEIDKSYYSETIKYQLDKIFSSCELKTLSAEYIYMPKDGKIVGKHNGAHYFTIGQRKGLGVGGKAEPLFVIATNVEQNVVYVGQGQEHSGLFRTGLFIDESELHWVRPDFEMKQDEIQEFMVRIRYRQPLQKAKLFRKTEGMYIIFEEPQRGIAAGQFAAWYYGEELIGSGVISTSH